MRINSNICSFIWANSTGLTSGVEGPLVDISFAQDLVMMGSQCGGSLDCFFLAIFWSWERLRDERNEVYLTMWKHNTEIKLVYVIII